MILKSIDVNFTILNINIDKILISNKVLFCKKGFKHLIGNKDEDKIKALCLMLAKTSGYAKSFDETKHMFFFYS